MKLNFLILFLLLFFTSFSFALLDTNLVSYYNFEETSGTNVIDIAGYDQNGTSSGMILNNSGKIGLGYAMNDNTDNINFGNIMDINGAKSINVWVKLSESLQNTDILISKSSGGGNQFGLNYRAYSDATGTSRPTGYIPTSQTADANLSISLNTWAMLTFTWDGTTNAGGAKIYVNGVLSDSHTATALGTTSSNNLYLGRNPNIGNNNSDANYDELGIWKRVLTQDEITTLYNNGNGLTYPQTAFNLTKPDQNYIQNVDINFLIKTSTQINTIPITLYLSDKNGDYDTLVYNDTNLLDATGIICQDYNFLDNTYCAINLNLNVDNNWYYVDANASLNSFEFKTYSQRFYYQSIKIDANFDYILDSINSRIYFYDLSNDTNVDINSWQWIINGSNVSNDQNFYYTTNANLDLNTCLKANGYGTDNNFYTDTICKNVNTWDTILPTIDVNIITTNFGFVNDFNIDFNMACYDNFTPVNYKIIWTNGTTNTTLYNSNDLNGSVLSSSLDLNVGQSALITFSCMDDSNNVASYVSDYYYALLFRLVDEETGVNLTYSDINNRYASARVYTTDGNYSYDFNATATTNTKFFSNSGQLFFEFEFKENNIKFNRQINFELTEDKNIAICSPDYQTLYQQRFVSNSARNIIVKNNISNCFVLASSLDYVYDAGYSLITYTIPMPYYLYTYSNGVKSYLALIDGSTATQYNIDAIEFTRSQFNIVVGQDTIAFRPLITSGSGLYDNNTIQIYYKSYDGLNDSLEFIIKNNDGEEIWNYTENTNPNEILLNFYWGSLDINYDDVLSLELIKNVDGVETTTTYYFTIFGDSYQTTSSNEWAAIIAILFFLFGITLVSFNRVFGIFGLIIIIISIFIITLASGAWWVNLITGAFIILAMYIILAGKQTTGGQLQ